jgi:hypothetical protein
MLACAFLPFLPLIVDAQISQLGDDDFAKREAATRMIQMIVQDTDGFRYRWILGALQRASQSINPEVRLRTRGLYLESRPRFFQEYPWLYMVVRADLRDKEKRLAFFSGQGRGMSYIVSDAMGEVKGADGKFCYIRVHPIHEFISAEIKTLSAEMKKVKAGRGYVVEFFPGKGRLGLERPSMQGVSLQSVYEQYERGVRAP